MGERRISTRRDGPRRFSFAALLLAFVVTALACSGDDASSSMMDASSVEDRGAPDATIEAGSGAGGAGGSGGTRDPRCAAANRNGFFPDCSLCGSDCDTIDDGTGTYEACGCTAGCPCGLHCGSYPIAPGVVVSDICIR